MLILCSKCDKPFEEGDAIMFTAIGKYHHIPSVRSWSVAKDSLEADVRSIKHLHCNKVEGD